MPRITSFTTKWFELMYAVGVENRTIVVECTTPKKALTLRAKWYSFKSALSSEKRESDLQTADNVVCTIEDGTRVSFVSREQQWDAQALSSALGVEAKDATS